MRWMVAVYLFVLLSSAPVAGTETAAFPPTPPAFLTNDAFITGLYTDFDLEDVEAVFRHAFAQLEDHVTVYPSEGYYYFRFPMRGLTVRGTFHLSAHNRDEGVLGFGYIGEIEDAPHGRYLEMPGRDHDFGPVDGLEMRRVDPFTYTCTWEGRTVVFHLHDPGLEPPAAHQLADDEEYVGTGFDESGLRFHLVFHRTLERLFWILDEGNFVPEAMTLLHPDVVRGARTRFVFYLDRELERKILIGVHASEVSYNTWYDGPFDQLPDTYVQLGKIDLREYLARHVGLDPDGLDRFGHFLGQVGRRVPVAPYRFYEDPAEFAFVAELDPGLTRAERLAALIEEAGRDLLAYPLRPPGTAQATAGD